MTTSRFAVLLCLFLTAPGASAGTLFVDAGLITGANDGSSWANAFQGLGGLQSALAVATPGDDVLVASGFYHPSPTGDRTASFQLATGVAIFGGCDGTEATPADRPTRGYLQETFLTGNIDGDPFDMSADSLHVVRASGAVTGATLDGFTIIWGNANGGAGDDVGGGLLVEGGASVTIRDCAFTANFGASSGGGVHVAGSAASLIGCSFLGNRSDGAGGAVQLSQAGAVEIARCNFVNNRAPRGGALGILATAGASVHNSIFQGNTVTGIGGGGAVWAGGGGDLQIANCTVVRNSSDLQAAAGLHLQGTSASVANSICFENAGPGGAQGASNQIFGTSNVTYCLVEGGFAGAGNSGAAPQFVPSMNPLADAFLPAPGSPALDAGDNSQVPAGVTLDYSGKPRFVDDPAPDTGSGSAPLVDIGASENQGPVFTPFCFGSSPCPCGNNGVLGSGCGNGSFASGSRLTAAGVPSVSNDSLVLRAEHSTPNGVGLFFQGSQLVAFGQGQLLGDGRLCVAQSQRTPPVVANASGVATSAVSLSSTLGVGAGEVKYYQWWYRDAALSPCGSGFNLSSALQFVWQQ